MYSIFVTINVQPAYVDAFERASLGDAQGSVRDEPGCFRFDIHQDVDVPTRFYLHEVYSDEEAFKAHQETPHYAKWRQEVLPYCDGQIEKVAMQTVFPSEMGWQKQKAGLVNW